MTELARLRVVTQGGSEHDIDAPLDMPAETFIDELVAALGLPLRDAEGLPVSWRLDNRETSRTLDAARDLGDNGVRDGHRLALVRQVIAG